MTQASLHAQILVCLLESEHEGFLVYLSDNIERSKPACFHLKQPCLRRSLLLTCACMCVDAQ